MFFFQSYHLSIHPVGEHQIKSDWSWCWLMSFAVLSQFELFWLLRRIGELQEVMKDISRKQGDEDGPSAEMGNSDRYKIIGCLVAFPVTGTAGSFTSVCPIGTAIPRPLPATLLSCWTGCPLRPRSPRISWWRTWVLGFMTVQTCWWWETRARARRLSSESSTISGNLRMVREQEIFRKT